VQILLRRKVDIEAKDSHWNTPLIAAVASGRSACVHALVDANADISAENVYGDSAVELAARNGHSDILATLLKAQTSALKASPSLPLSRPTRTLRATCIDTDALDVDIERTDHNGNTPLLVAARYNHLADVSLLLKNKASIEARNNAGASALMLVAMDASGRSDALMVRLTHARADIDGKNSRGETALMVAAYHGSQSMVERLLAVKADVNLCDKQGNTALSLAARHGATAVVQRLLSAKANVSARDKHRKTALYWAVQFGAGSCVSALRAAGAKD